MKGPHKLSGGLEIKFVGDNPFIMSLTRKTVFESVLDTKMDVIYNNYVGFNFITIIIIYILVSLS